MGYYENENSIKLTVLRKKRNGKMKSQDNGLENDIASLEKTLDEENLSETQKNQILDELAARKLQREEMAIHKTKGAIIRSKARWFNEGGKNEKFPKSWKTTLKFKKKNYQKSTAVR